MPPHSRSAGSLPGEGGRGGQRCVAQLMPKAVSTAIANTALAPVHANTTPASAGPTARAPLKAIDTSVMACGSSLRSTVSLTAEFHEGDCSAVHTPSRKVKNSSVPGPTQPASARPVSTAAAAAYTPWMRSISARRLVVSASTPAGSDSKNIGRKEAVCTSAARNDEAVSSIISHEAAMFCMALPTKNRPPAVHSPRNGRCSSGRQMEGAGAVAAGVWGFKRGWSVGGERESYRRGPPVACRAHCSARRAAPRCSAPPGRSSVLGPAGPFLGVRPRRAGAAVLRP
jgi:hypothetical protein